MSAPRRINPRQPAFWPDSLTHTGLLISRRKIAEAWIMWDPTTGLRRFSELLVGPESPEATLLQADVHAERILEVAINSGWLTRTPKAFLGLKPQADPFEGW